MRQRDFTKRFFGPHDPVREAGIGSASCFIATPGGGGELHGHCCVTWRRNRVPHVHACVLGRSDIVVLCRDLVGLVQGDMQQLCTRGRTKDQLPAVCPRRTAVSASRGRKLRWAWTLVAALLLCGWCNMAPFPAAASEGALQAHASMGAPLIHLHDGHISVRLHHAPWAMVLQELERCTGAKITVASPLSGALTLEFAALPLEQGLRRLFRDVSWVMRLAPGATTAGTAGPGLHIWLFPQGELAAGQPETLSAHGQATRGVSEAVQGTPAEDGATERAPAGQFQTLHVLAQQGNLHALQQALRDPDPFIQATAFTLFAEQDRQGAIAAVLSLSASEQSEQRWQALQLLHQSEAFDEETVLATLHAALADMDTAVKSYAIQALADRGGAKAFEHLHQAFRDPDPAIRLLVLESVIQLDDGLPLVQEGLADAEETIRALARSRLEPVGSITQ